MFTHARKLLIQEFLTNIERILSNNYNCDLFGIGLNSKKDLEKRERDVRGIDYLNQGIIRLMVDGPTGLGKKLFLEKITDFLSNEGFLISEPKKHEEMGSWLIEIRKQSY